jgi:battenin
MCLQGIVYLCAIVPGIILKASAPYWVHTVPYAARVLACAALMSASFAVVGLSSSRGPQLAGVVLASLQGALGEASFLALSSYYNADATITAWSSGTGFAGVFGYSWVAGLHVALGFSFQQTLAAAQVTAGAFVAAYFLLLEPPEARVKQVRDMIDADEQLVGAAMEALGDGGGSGGGYGSSSGGGEVEGFGLAVPPRGRGLPGSSYGRGDAEEEEGDDDDDDAAALLPPTARDRTPPRAALAKRSKAHRMSARERFTRTLALWPYTVPLFAVYAAEYTMQVGVRLIPSII